MIKTSKHSFKQLNKARRMKIKKLLILTALILTFCTTAFAEENKSSKYPNIKYLSPAMEEDLELADNGDHEATYNVAMFYGAKFWITENNARKKESFMMYMLAIAEAQGSKKATQILDKTIEKTPQYKNVVLEHRRLAKKIVRLEKSEIVSGVVAGYCETPIAMYR